MENQTEKLHPCREHIITEGEHVGETTEIERLKEDYSYIVKYALVYLEKYNLSIVPTTPGIKGPPKVSWKEYQKKKPTVEEVKEWWRKCPDSGVAIVTGKINDLITLDIDPRHGGLETIRDKEIPKTGTVRTGGGGLHYYFKYPELDEVQNFTGDNVGLPGIDLRGDGGIIYVPPQIHPSGNKYKFEEGLAPWEVRLAPAPTWLLDVIKKHSVGSNNNSKSKNSKVDFGQKWQGANAGNRNNTCASLAGKLAHSGASQEEATAILIEWNKNNTDSNGNPNPLPQAEVVKTVSNIYLLHQQSNNKKGKEKEKFLPSTFTVSVRKKLRKKFSTDLATLWLTRS